MINYFKNNFKNIFVTRIKKKGWAKVEDKSKGPLSWTEYTDHNGFVFTIYDMMIYPATPDAYAYLKEE